MMMMLLLWCRRRRRVLSECTWRRRRRPSGHRLRCGRIVVLVELIATHVRIGQRFRVRARHHLIVRIVIGARHDLDAKFARQLSRVAGVDALRGGIGAGVGERDAAVNERLRVLQDDVVAVENVGAVLVEKGWSNERT